MCEGGVKTKLKPDWRLSLLFNKSRNFRRIKGHNEVTGKPDMWLRRKLQIIKEQKRPFCFLFSRFLRYSGMWRLFRIRRKGYSLKLHPAAISMSFFCNPNECLSDSLIIERLLRKGEIYVDVGANIDHLAIEAALVVGNNGKVFAFEAHPRTAQYLRENIALNQLSNIRVGQFAASNRYGWTAFSDCRSDDQNRILNDGDCLIVPMVRLESFLEGENITLLKIDVEVYEKYVLEGMQNVLHNVTFIYFESMASQYEEAGYHFADIYDILEAAGFRIVALHDDRAEIVWRMHVSDVCENLLAFRDENMLVERLGVKVWPKV